VILLYSEKHDLRRLHSRGPLRDVYIVRLIHYFEHHLYIVLVLGRKLAPQAVELRVRWPALANDRTIPTCVVVDVKDAQRSAAVQATLHQAVVVCKVGRVKGASEIAVDEVLPANRQTEGVQTVILDEVVHLPDAIGAGVYGARHSAGAVGATAKVEASDVDAGVGDLTRAGRGSRRSDCRCYRGGLGCDGGAGGHGRGGGLGRDRSRRGLDSGRRLG